MSLGSNSSEIERNRALSLSKIGTHQTNSSIKNVRFYLLVLILVASIRYGWKFNKEFADTIFTDWHANHIDKLEGYIANIIQLSL